LVLLDIEPFRYQSTSDTKVVRSIMLNNGIIALFYAYGIYAHCSILTVGLVGKSRRSEWEKYELLFVKGMVVNLDVTRYRSPNACG
jgi:hypothetical protein